MQLPLMLSSPIHQSNTTEMALNLQVTDRNLSPLSPMPIRQLIKHIHGGHKSLARSIHPQNMYRLLGAGMVELNELSCIV